MRVRGFLVLAACWALSTPVLAGDGVIEINQAAALAGSVTPGDAANFPVTLSQPGSYRLTSNLDSPIGTGAIVIASPYVTLDLGGFTVQSTNACTGYPTNSCAVSNGAAGISAGAANFLAIVRNGVVTGMGGDCISLEGSSSEVDRVRAFACAGHGIDMQIGGASRVTNSFAGLNRLHGIFVDDGSEVGSNEVRANGEDGIRVAGTRLVVRVSGNRIFDNFRGAVTNQSAIQPVATENVMANNGFVFAGFVVSLGDNLCQNVVC